VFIKNKSGDRIGWDASSRACAEQDVCDGERASEDLRMCARPAPYGRRGGARWRFRGWWGARDRSGNAWDGEGTTTKLRRHGVRANAPQGSSKHETMQSTGRTVTCTAKLCGDRDGGSDGGAWLYQS